MEQIYAIHLYQGVVSKEKASRKFPWDFPGRRNWWPEIEFLDVLDVLGLLFAGLVTWSVHCVQPAFTLPRGSILYDWQVSHHQWQFLFLAEKAIKTDSMIHPMSGKSASQWSIVSNRACPDSELKDLILQPNDRPSCSPREVPWSEQDSQLITKTWRSRSHGWRDSGLAISIICLVWVV